MTDSHGTAGAVSIGVDVGGTFTDLVAVHADGRVHVAKVLTTPADRADGVISALAKVPVPAASVSRLSHGTTVVTNLLLERAGARVVLLATAGFTDLLWLRRQDRASLYDLTAAWPSPLVDDNDVVPVRERLAPVWDDGQPTLAVIEVLSDEACADAVRAAVARRADVYAVSLLHAFDDPQHEQRLAHALRVALRATAEFERSAHRDAAHASDARALHATVPDVVCSHEVLPEIREYERTATTVAEAYARPAVRHYMARFSSAVHERGYPAPRVMTSSGGTVSALDSARHAASLALSGPAGGVTGAAALCRAIGVADALTIDIGGTSADVGLIRNGEPLVERGGDVAGAPIALPRVLVETVAAGGGSIGRVDAGGALHAGPASAGAVPGPACYGQGGEHATITDAHVVLGHIDAGTWGGGVHIDASLAQAAIARLAEPLGTSVREAAAALIATADATMARALRRVSVERGLDPRDLPLVAFGGGGPLHACGLADALGMSAVYIPPHAGVLSALGLALAPERREGLASVMRSCATIDAEYLHALREELVHSLADAPDATPHARTDHKRTDHARTAHTEAAPVLTQRAWARARYVGQGHELDVPLDDALSAPAATPSSAAHEAKAQATGSSTIDGMFIAHSFNALHHARFGFTLPRDVEVVSVRVALEGAAWPYVPAATVFAGIANATRADSMSDDSADGGVADGHRIQGPRTVPLADATLRVAAGWHARPLPTGGWWMERLV